MVFIYVGDALWVLGLSIMFSASRTAARRIPANARPPLMGVALPRALFLWALPASVFLLSLWFVVQAREPAADPDMPLIVFGVRASLAALLALLHLRWLGQGMKALEAKGELKP
jgi:hypothetical protein